MKDLEVGDSSSSTGRLGRLRLPPMAPKQHALSAGCACGVVLRRSLEVEERSGVIRSEGLSGWVE